MTKCKMEKKKIYKTMQLTKQGVNINAQPITILKEKPLRHQKRLEIRGQSNEVRDRAGLG